MTERDQDVGSAVLEHTRETGHSVTWDTEGDLTGAQCTGCSWPNG